MARTAENQGSAPGERCSAALPFVIESAGIQGDTFRVRGVMNSFGAQHSRRLLHPAAFKKWLAAKSPDATLPMLAQHGNVMGGFATVGQWDQFAFDPKRGMIWGGYVGKGTQLTDEARALLSQRLLKQLSVGWITRQARYVRLTDADLDPELRRAMEESHIDEAQAFLDWYPVEGSLVDVADDPNALLAARSEAGATATIAALRADVDAVRAELAEFKTGGGNVLWAALDEALADWVAEFKNAAINALQSDLDIGDAATGLREDLAEVRTGSAAGAESGDFATLRSRLARFGKKAGR